MFIGCQLVLDFWCPVVGAQSTYESNEAGSKVAALRDGNNKPLPRWQEHLVSATLTYCTLPQSSAPVGLQTSFPQVLLESSFCLSAK